MRPARFPRRSTLPPLVAGDYGEHVMHFLTEFWFEPLPWYPPLKFVNWGLCWFDYMVAMVLAGAGTLFV